MKQLGFKIKELRQNKGLSQEELSELSKVSLRTIQRIEKNTNAPSGKTLNLICESLQLNLEDLLEYGKKEDKGFLTLFHFTVLSFIFLPLGNIIVPLILWLTKKEEIVGLKEIGASLLNFQILWTIATTAIALLSVFGKLLDFGNFLIILILTILLNIALPIYFIIKSNYGSKTTFYPNIKFLRIIK
jgi:transcriptional regulator with XRE-family HTH domain